MSHQRPPLDISSSSVGASHLPNDLETLAQSAAGPPAATPPGTGPSRRTGGSLTREEELIGAQLGEYQVTGTIGKGGMGMVLSGVHPLIGKKVAIKLIRPELCENPDVMGRFLAEAKAVNAIGHRNIIDIFAFGTMPDSTQYFVMEYLDGETLSALIKRLGVVPYREAYAIVSQVLSAVQAAHAKGIIHRDLKPENIFLTQGQTGEPFVKLLDFGIAKFSADGFKSGHTATGMPIGTPHYMAPEQCAGQGVDLRSDIYSLGIILYEMFTGQTPFRADSVAALILAHYAQPPTPPSQLANLPEDLEDTILACLEKMPEDRPQTIAALLERLLPSLKRLANASPGASPERISGAELPALRADRSSLLGSQLMTRPDARPRRSPVLAVGITLGLAVAVGLGLYLGLRPTDRQRSAPTAAGEAKSSPAAVDAGRPGGDAPGKTVLIQLQIEPTSAPAVVTVDGKPQEKRFFRVPESDSREIEIAVTAPGYQAWSRRILPGFSQNLTVILAPVGSGQTSPGGGRPRPGAGTRPGDPRPAMEPPREPPRTPPREPPRRRERPRAFGVDNLL